MLEAGVWTEIRSMHAVTIPRRTSTIPSSPNNIIISGGNCGTVHLTQTPTWLTCHQQAAALSWSSWQWTCSLMLRELVERGPSQLLIIAETGVDTHTHTHTHGHTHLHTHTYTQIHLCSLSNTVHLTSLNRGVRVTEN